MSRYPFSFVLLLPFAVEVVNVLAMVLVMLVEMAVMVFLEEMVLVEEMLVEMAVVVVTVMVVEASSLSGLSHLHFSFPLPLLEEVGGKTCGLFLPKDGSVEYETGGRRNEPGETFSSYIHNCRKDDF